MRLRRPELWRMHQFEIAARGIVDRPLNQIQRCVAQKADAGSIVDGLRAMYRVCVGEEWIVIVLDHADEDVWGDLPNVVLAEEWRERALVPLDWLDEE